MVELDRNTDGLQPERKYETLRTRRATVTLNSVSRDPRPRSR